MKITILIGALITLLSPNVYAADNISTAKKHLIDQLLEQTGQSAITVGKQFSNAFIQQITNVLKKTNPNIDPKALDIVEDEVISVINEEMVIKDTLKNMMYPIYNRHFTQDELKKMIELNNTEFGKKIIRVMPLISQEGMQAGQKFGQTLGPKIQKRISSRFQKEGIK